MAILCSQVERSSVVIVLEVNRVALSDKSLQLSEVSTACIINKIHFQSLLVMNLLELKSLSVNYVNIVVVEGSTEFIEKIYSLHTVSVLIKIRMVNCNSTNIWNHHNRHS